MCLGFQNRGQQTSRYSIYQLIKTADLPNNIFYLHTVSNYGYSGPDSCHHYCPPNSCHCAAVESKSSTAVLFASAYKDGSKYWEIYTPLRLGSKPRRPAQTQNPQKYPWFYLNSYCSKMTGPETGSVTPNSGEISSII